MIDGPHIHSVLLRAFKAGEILDATIGQAIAAHLGGCTECEVAYEGIPEVGQFRLMSELQSDRSQVVVSENAAAEPVTRGNWKLLGVLGEGGNGVVWLGRHRLLDSIRAIKVLRSTADDRLPLQCAIREMRVNRIPVHDNLIRVYSVDECEQDLLIEMEPVVGEDLESLSARQPGGVLPYSIACGYMLQVLRGIQHASGHGLLHRDLKPGNLMLRVDGRISILDFSLASQVSDDAGQPITQAGLEGVGTVAYLSPEQAADLRSADLRSELYSLGCTLYRLIAGHPPFGPETGHFGKLAVLQAHRYEQPGPLVQLRSDVPRQLSQIVDQLLAKDPADRFASAANVASQLLPYVEASDRQAATVWLETEANPKCTTSPLVNSDQLYRRFLLIAVAIIVTVLPGLYLLRNTLRPSLPVAAAPESHQATTAAKATRKPAIYRGRWFIDGEELVQSSLQGGWGIQPLLTFGDPDWKDYDFTVDFQKTSDGSIIFCFHADGENERSWFSPVCYDQGRGTELAHLHKGTWDRADGNFQWQADPPELNAWYTVRLEIRGSHFRCFLGDHLQFEHQDSRYTSGLIGLSTWSAACRFRNLKVTSPSGSVLWEDFPDIPPESASNQELPNSVLAAEPTDVLLTPPHPDLAKVPFGVERAHEHQAQWANYLQQPTEFLNSQGITLCLVPPGTFLIGSPEDEDGRKGDEIQSERTLTRPFYLGAAEITREQWTAVMKTTPWAGRKYVREGENLPASHVSARDAEDFLVELNKLEANTELLQRGWVYRLPTEAEWEYACRAGTISRFCFGDDESRLADYAWYGGVFGEGNCQAEQHVHEVMLKRPNALGLYDMHGNLGEWCSDHYAPGYYEQSPSTNPRGPETGINRSLRGGSWYYYGSYCRSAQRNGFSPFHRSYDLGFRIALEPRIPVEPAVE